MDAEGWRREAQTLRAQGRHAQALDAFDAARAAAEAAADPLLAARVQIGAIDSLAMLERFDDALALAERLERVFDAAGAVSDAARARANAGGVHLRRDRYAEALECYQRAAVGFDAAGDATALAVARVNSAIALTHLGRAEDAFVLYDQARATFAEAGREFEAAVVDADQGHLLHASGRLLPALRALTAAEDAFARLGRPHEQGRCAVDLAQAQRALNLLPEALASAERALAIFAERPLEYDRARAERERAAALLGLGRADAAAEALERALELFVAQENPPQQAFTRLARAHLHRALGREDAARADAAAAAALFAEHGLHTARDEAALLLAEADGAPEPLRALADAAAARADAWLECRARRALGRSLAARGERDAALEPLRRAVALLEDIRTLLAPEDIHLAFLQDKLGAYEDLLGLLLERADDAATAEALDLVERTRSRLLLERLRRAVEPAILPQLPEPLRERLQRLRTELSRAYHDGDLPGGARRPGPRPPVEGTLEGAYRAALRDAQLVLPDRRLAFGEVAGVEALQEALGPDETLLAYFGLQGRLGAFVVDRQRVRVIPQVATVEAVSAAARRLRYQLQKREMRLPLPETQLLDDVHKSLADLHALLLAPVEAHLDRPLLTVVPHGPLHGLPFAALGPSREVALDRWDILLAPSATVWWEASRRGDPPCGDALVMAVPAPGIEQVADEASGIARRILAAGRGVQNLCGDAATVDAFRTHAPEAAVLHLATHAHFRADAPLFSGLRLADRWLLAHDLYELPLRARLVTLSACHTGASWVDAGDELFGITRGFLAAGARSVVASLWSADDAATAGLMDGFYARLLEGETPSAALRDAQRTLRARFPHPYFWAPFVAIGARRPVWEEISL